MSRHARNHPLKILHDLLTDLRKSVSIPGEMAEELQSLRMAENNPAAEDLVRGFEEPDKWRDHDQD